MKLKLKVEPLHHKVTTMKQVENPLTSHILRNPPAPQEINLFIINLNFINNLLLVLNVISPEVHFLNKCGNYFIFHILKCYKLDSSFKMAALNFSSTS